MDLRRIDDIVKNIGEFLGWKCFLQKWL